VKEDSNRRDLGSGTLGSSSWAGSRWLLIALRGPGCWGDGSDLRVGDGSDDLRVGRATSTCALGATLTYASRAAAKHFGGGGDALWRWRRRALEVTAATRVNPIVETEASAMRAVE
jgi:hypothetical protein